jgi:hypothetical protein
MVTIEAKLGACVEERLNQKRERPAEKLRGMFREFGDMVERNEDHRFEANPEAAEALVDHLVSMVKRRMWRLSGHWRLCSAASSKRN